MPAVTVWSHDAYAIPHDVLMHPSAFPAAKAGDVAQIKARVDDGTVRKFYFIVGPSTESATTPLSLSAHVLAALGIVPRDTVQLSLRDRESVTTDTAELRFKGVYLTRADLYRISKSLTGQCIRVGQRVPFLGGTVRLQVESIWQKGKRKYSGYIGQETNIVYRSDSARVILLIQLSIEMWDFDETGEIGFQKLVNSFIPESLRQWGSQGTQHTITIILFTSLSSSKRRSRLLPGELEPKPQNHYRVAVDAAPATQWSEIMSTLRREFIDFKSVLLTKQDNVFNATLPASKGNILEALRLTTSFTSNKFSDRDLCRTNLQVVVITASPGLFDVDEVDLYQLSRIILGVEIGVELVCLSRPPLHITPMFRAKTHGGIINHYVPTWMNVSFWGPTERYVKQWIPRSRIYDIQMMGVMENEKKAISVRHITPGPYTSRYMKNYDAYIFKAAVSGITSENKEIADSQTQSINQMPPHSTSMISLQPSTIGSVHTTAIALPTVTFAEPAIVGEKASSQKSLRSSLDSVLKTSSKKLHQKGSLMTLRDRFNASVSDITSPILSSANSIRSNKTHKQSLEDSPKQSFTWSVESASSTSETPVPSAPKPTAPAVLARAMPIPMPDSRNSTLRKQNSQRVLEKMRTSPSMSPSLKVVRKMGSLSPSKLVAPASKTSSGNSFRLTTPQNTQPLSVASQGNMWRLLKNPSVIDDPNRTEAYGRWAYVYPPNTKRKNISWNSLKSPASLPITSDVFPTVQQFNDDFKFQFYDLAIIPGNSPLSTPQLLDELIGSRLMMGFQIAEGDLVAKVEASSVRGNPALLKQIIPQENFVGVRLYMVREGLIHRLCIEQDDLINVRIYTWVNPDRRLANAEPQTHADVFFRTKYEAHASKLKGHFFDPLSQFNIKWNLLDQQICGLVDYFNDPSAQYTRATRFVIIPVPTNKSDSAVNHDKASIEDLRVDGILKVVAYVFKHQVKSTVSHNDNMSPQVTFYTGFLNRVPDSLFLDAQEATPLAQHDRLNKSISLENLASEISGKWGPKRQSRRWHWKTYHGVIQGDVMINWLAHNFSDINTREDAIKYAQTLLDQNVLDHVNGRKKFGDGHFFYTLNAKYKSEEQQEEQSSQKINKKTRIAITRSLMVDIDPKKLTPRPEICQVHIDRFHNPEHAFNIRAEWLNSTPKLLDEFFSGISRICNNYALRLVQVPKADIADTEKHSPFRSSYVVSFCLDPLSVVPNPERFADAPFYFHHQFLKRMGFVFDGTEMDFQSDEFLLDYTWRNSEFHRAQYIYHSGAMIVQILEDMSFYMVPNTIFLSRYMSGPSSQSGLADTIQGMFEKICTNAEALEEIFVEAAQQADSLDDTLSVPEANDVL